MIRLLRYPAGIVLTACGLLDAPAAAGLFGPDLEKVDRSKTAAENAGVIADRFARKYPDRCLVIAVVEGGVRTVEARGTLPDGSAVDVDTRFEIGSVTKTLTGLLLADAVQRGEVTLETTLADLLPDRELAEGVADITLRQLATHRSGLPRMPPDIAEGADAKNPYAHYTPEKLFESLASVDVNGKRPEEYSNYGAGLVGDVLAARAGTTYERLLSERVLTPLGLGRTSVGPGEGLPSVAPPHSAKLPTPAWDFGAIAGCGGVRSSAADMLHYAETVLRPAGPLQDAIELATSPQESADGETGLFWQVDRRNGGRVLWHNGATYGTGSYLAVDRAKGRCVLVMKNSTNLLRLFTTGPLTDRIGAALIGLPDTPKG